MDLLGEDFSGLQVKSIYVHCLNKMCIVTSRAQLEIETNDY